MTSMSNPRVAPLGIMLALLPLTAAAQVEICQFPAVDPFLDKCPTNDPAIAQILNDFTITVDGAPVTFPPSSCTEPVSAMPVAQYTNQLSLLQALRAVYYMNGRSCGYLPWTSLSLYDWLRSKVGGFNIDSTATYDNCCGTLPSGRPFITLRAADDSNRAYHRTWEGLAEWVALLMHEARHVDGFPHVNCCPSGAGACDQTYDLANLSPYGVQYWLERAWLEGNIYSGYTCLPQARITAIQSWLRSAANDRPTRFCTNPPPVLTDANDPPPACETTCTTSRACGVPTWGAGRWLFYLRHAANGQSTFGTISISGGSTTDLFPVTSQSDALAFAAPNVGYGPNLFYFLHHDGSGFSTLGTISPSSAVTGRMGAGSQVDALTFVAPDLGYGPNLFYFLSHDANGFDDLWTLSTSGSAVKRFGVGYRVDALTFAAPNVGYGPNLLYYVRHDANGFSTLGTISTSGAVTDRMGAGNRVDALTFTPQDLGYGPNLFYYLRHDTNGASTFGTLSTSGAVTDRFGVGNQFDDLVALPTADLTVTKTGSGIVSSNLPGIDCGSTCSASYGPGTRVTLAESPGTGATFSGWSGRCNGSLPVCMLTASTPSSAAATFTGGGCQIGGAGGSSALGAVLVWLARWRRRRKGSDSDEPRTASGSRRGGRG